MDGTGAPGTPAQEPDAAAPTPGWLESAAELVHALRDGSDALISLVFLETRLAVRSLVTLLWTLAWLAVVLATAWLAGMASIALWFMQAGMPPALAALAIVMVNLLMVPVLAGVISRCHRRLGWPVTRDTCSRVARLIRNPGNGH